MQIDDLKKQVDQSNVAAVREAYDELERTRRQANRQLDSYQVFVGRKLRGILDERDQSVAALKHKIKARAGSLWLARDLLLIYALCSLKADPIILLDLQEILIYIGLLLKEFCEWICCPCYVPYPGGESLPYEAGTAWAIRIVSVIAGMAFEIGMLLFCIHVLSLIRAQWCRFAKRITISLLIIVSTLGTLIKAYLQWNTVVIFFVLFIIVMKVLHRLEISYTQSHKSDEWEQIKEHNDRSYYVTYHIYKFFR